MAPARVTWPPGLPGGRRTGEVAHQHAEQRHEPLRLRHVLVVRQLEDRVGRVGVAEEAGVGVAQHAAFVDEHGVLLARARAGHLMRRVVEAGAAVRRVDVAAALREALRPVQRGGAGGVLGEPRGRGCSVWEGGVDRVEVGLERAAARVVHVIRALGGDVELEVVGVISCCGEAETPPAEEKERKKAVHG